MSSMNIILMSREVEAAAPCCKSDILLFGQITIVLDQLAVYQKRYRSRFVDFMLLRVCPQAA